MASVELYSGEPGPVLDYAQHATPSSFKAGDLVTIDSTGGIKIASAAVKFLGIARQDADTVAGQRIPVELIDSNAIYSVRISTTGSDTTTGTSDTALGDAFGFVFTAGAHAVSDTLTASVYMVGIDDRDDTGTVGGRILVRFYGTALTAQY